MQSSRALDIAVALSLCGCMSYSLWAGWRKDGGIISITSGILLFISGALILLSIFHRTVAISASAGIATNLAVGVALVLSARSKMTRPGKVFALLAGIYSIGYMAYLLSQWPR